tara:strand:+ start:2734 stop:3687 length:954 start_codon:yes stop_codon:yes gene_type:complete
MTIFNVDNYLSRHFNKTETGDFFVAVLNFLSASTHNRTFVSWDVSFIDIWPMIKSACHYLNIDPETCVLDGIFAVIDPKQYNMPIMQDRYAFRNLGNPSVALNQAEPDSGPMLLHMIGRPTWQRTAVTAWCWYHHRNRVKISYQLSENFMDQQGLDTFWKETRPDSKWHDVFSAWCSRDNILIDDIGDVQTHNQLYDGDFHWSSYPAYNNTCLEIVCESVMENEYCLSEKIIRPMLRGRPFVALAAPGYLDWLHKQGFETFNHAWSEEYDESSGWTRVDETCNVIDHILHNISWQDIWNKTRSQCEHNKNILKKLCE